jgi:hypothetical protein
VVEIAVAIGHRAVGDLEQELQEAVLLLTRIDQGLPQQLHQLQRPLDAPAELEEDPVVAARHRLGRQAGQGRGMADQPVQVRPCLRRVRRAQRLR